MALRAFAFTILCLLSTPGLQGQEQDPVLFTVEDQVVPVSEFKYIYEKTNGEHADYSRKSVEEYLDLYVKFKLKVQRARDMQLDTIPTLQKELAGYRRTLASSYLIDKEVTDKLVAEAYERLRYDVDISHLLIRVAPEAIPEDTLAAYRKAEAARERIAGGEDFAAVAREVSEDKSAKDNSGRIGFVTALFPDGYYPMETAAYTLEPGQVSSPIRTSAGYHILIVHDRRPARGEVEAAHIMLRTKDKDAGLVKVRIDSIYQALQQGTDFEELARNRSEDSFTAEKGGYIGFFGINRYESAFEDAAFAIAEDGAFSPPVQTSIGWHIIKRISKRDIQPFEVERRRLQTKVMQDARHERARRALIDRIQEEGNFSEYPETLDAFADQLTDDFLTFRWKAPNTDPGAVLFTLEPDFEATLGDFSEFLLRENRQRVTMGRGTDLRVAVDKLYDRFVDERIIAYEERRLEQKYPEFRHLMNEYEQGILLFEATQREVWNKASQDTAGLEAFFEKVRSKYRWDERAQVSLYRLSSEAADREKAVRAYAADHSADEVLAKFNAEDNIILSAEEKILEKTRNDLLIGTPWKVGALSPTREGPRQKTLTFMKIEELIPPALKTLDEARGYVIAEYQDYLENQWVKQLKEQYDVSLNEQVLESLIKE